MKINGDLRFRTLGSGELQNAVIERVNGGAAGGSLPTGVEGRIAFNLDSNTYWFYGGGQWNEFGGGGDLTNIINSGGYMNGDGTFDATAFNGFTNVVTTGSPFANLIDALEQMDAAISTAAGVDTLKELTDVEIDGEGTSPALATGQILYYDGSNWTQTSVTALSSGDILTWNGTNWEPTENTNVLALPDLTDVDNAVTSGATDGQLLRYNSGAAAGSEWDSEDIEYIRQTDGFTYISTTGAGAINPRVDGNGIWMYVDDSGSATLVQDMTASAINITGVADGQGGGQGADVTIAGGQGSTNYGGYLNLYAGDATAYYGGSVTMEAGDGGAGYAGGGSYIAGGAGGSNAAGGPVSVMGGFGSGGYPGGENPGGVLVLGGGIKNNQGGGFNSGDGGGVLIQGGDADDDGADGGDIIMIAGSGVGAGDAGDVQILAGTEGNTGGDIALVTGGSTGQVTVADKGANKSGRLRFANDADSQYIALTVDGDLASDILYQLPDPAIGSPDDATYVLGIDTLTTGGVTANVMKWVTKTQIGGNSFATWVNSGGSTDGSIVADSTNDTATFVSGTVAAGGINIDFNATTDTMTFALSNSGLSGAATVAGTDTLWFNDIGTGINYRTFDNLFADLDVPNGISVNGIVVRDGIDSYTSRTITVSSAVALDGLDIVNGNLVAGNAVIGLDLASLTTLATDGDTIDVANDYIPFYNASNNASSVPANQRMTISELGSAIAGAGVINLGDLGDVTAAGPADGDIMYYQSGSPAGWVINQPGATSGIQAHDVGLDSLAGLSATANDFIIATGADAYTTIASGTTGRNLLGDETVADAITTLGLDSGGASDIWVDVAGDTMTGDLNMCGGSPDSARVLLSAGVEGTPSLTFCIDPDTGLYRGSDNELNFTTGGTERLSLDATRAEFSALVYAGDGAAATPAYTFTSDTNTGVYNVEADILGVSAGGTERVRVYGKDFDLVGSPALESAAGAVSVEATSNYEDLIGDPKSMTTFLAPIDDFLPNARWVEQYFLQLSGGSMSGDLVMTGAGTEINMDGGKIINLATPTNALDAANKAYVDSLSAGLIWIDPVYFVDLLKDNVQGDVTRSYQAGAGGGDAIVSDVETSDMLIAATAGNWTAIGGVGSPGNSSVTAAGVGDVMRHQDDAANSNADPSWENLGNIANTTLFPTERTAGQGAASTRWFTRVQTAAALGGTFVNSKECGTPDARDGVVVSLVDSNPFSRIVLAGSPASAQDQTGSPQYYDAWWGKCKDCGTQQVVSVTAAAPGTIDANDYFYITAGLGQWQQEGSPPAPQHPGPMQTQFYVWFNKGGGTDPDPYNLSGGDLDGQYAIEVDISGAADADAVADAIVSAINTYRPCTFGNNPLIFSAEEGASSTEVLITDQHSGANAAPADVNTGLTISVDTAGVDPAPGDGAAFFVNNPSSNNFGKQFTFTAVDPTGSPCIGGEWREIGATSSIVDGVGLSFTGNILNVNLGAGIFELPGDQVGIELWNATSGAIILTTDGSTRSTDEASRLHLLLSAAGGLDQNATGLFIQSGGVTNDMLENGSGILVSGDAGTPTATQLGEGLVFDGTNGVVVTVGNVGSPASDTSVTIDLSSVPTSALANDHWTLNDDGAGTLEVTLADTVTVNGGIVSPTSGNQLSIRRLQDDDNDTYVQVSASESGDEDAVNIVAPGVGAGTATFDATGAQLTGDLVDIDADSSGLDVDSAGPINIEASGAGNAIDLISVDSNINIETSAGSGASIILKPNTQVEIDDGKALHFYDAGSSNYIGFVAPALTADTDYTLPEAPAMDDYVLTSTAAGVMSWAAPSTVGRTRIEDLDDISANTSGSPLDAAGSILVQDGGSPVKYEAAQIQYIYDSTLTSGSPTASTSHTINHNLGQKFVNVTVYNTADQQILPQSVTLNSANQITVTLNAAIDITVVIMGVPGVVAKDGS